MKAGPKEAESPPMGSETVQTMAETTVVESSGMVREKDQSKRRQRQRWIRERSPKALPNERPKADSISTGPEKMMAFLKARSK